MLKRKKSLVGWINEYWEIGWGKPNVEYDIEYPDVLRIKRRIIKKRFLKSDIKVRITIEEL